MMTPPSGAWSVCKQLFADHWDACQRAHPRYQTSYSEGLVAKMLACGNPEKMGDVGYRCWHCGQGKPRVSMRGKSSLCWRCAKVYVDNWVSQGSKVLHEGGSIATSSCRGRRCSARPFTTTPGSC